MDEGRKIPVPSIAKNGKAVGEALVKLV